MAAGVTPPGSISGRPLTPPPTEEKPLSTRTQAVINFFRRHREGSRPNAWTRYYIDSGDYERLLSLLDADKNLRSYIDDKVRYDYDPRYSRLSVRMPSPLHETLCAEIVWEISNQLKVLQKGSGPEAVFAKQIKNLGSSRIDLPQESMDGERRFSRREPDASFGHCQARYPGVVVEVCYSQKSREIYRLADDYILSSDGSINAVVCINVEYKASKKATFSVWRPTYHTKDGAVEFRSTCVVKEQVFRTNDGQPSSPTSLRLTLKDFGTEELTQEWSDLNHEITISSGQLYDYLLEAEERQEAYMRRVGSVNNIRPGALKRQRTETPPDDSGSSTDSDSEAKRKINKRGPIDSDYSPGSSLTSSDH